MTTTRIVLGNSFADLPAALLQLGRPELVEDDFEREERPAPAVTPHQPFPEVGGTAVGTGPAPDPGPEHGQPDEELPPQEPDGLRSLVAELAGAAETLDALIRRDRQQREAALRELERYDAAVAAAAEAASFLARASETRVRAAELAAGAMEDDVRDAARRVAETAARAEERAARWSTRKRDEVDAFEVAPAVQRALAERRRREEARDAAQRAEATARGRAEALQTARVAADAGWLDEARATLRAALLEHPEDADLGTALREIEARELARRVQAAERAIWAARVQFRRRPAEAIEQLLSLDLGGLPAPLASQVFGAWTRACARLCRERGMPPPLCYAPRRAQGVVLVRERSDRPYTVLSVLGMGLGWVPGAPVDERLVERALPLVGKGVVPQAQAPAQAQTDAEN